MCYHLKFIKKSSLFNSIFIVTCGIPHKPGTRPWQIDLDIWGKTLGMQETAALVRVLIETNTDTGVQTSTSTYSLETIIADIKVSQRLVFCKQSCVCLFFKQVFVLLVYA